MNLDVEAHPSSGLPAFYYILFNLQRKILAQAFAYVVSGMYGDPLGSLSGEVSPRGLKFWIGIRGHLFSISSGP